MSFSIGQDMLFDSLLGKIGYLLLYLARQVIWFCIGQDRLFGSVLGKIGNLVLCWARQFIWYRLTWYCDVNNTDCPQTEIQIIHIRKGFDEGKNLNFDWNQLEIKL